MADEQDIINSIHVTITTDVSPSSKPNILNEDTPTSPASGTAPLLPPTQDDQTEPTTETSSAKAAEGISEQPESPSSEHTPILQTRPVAAPSHLTRPPTYHNIQATLCTYSDSTSAFMTYLKGPGALTYVAIPDSLRITVSTGNLLLTVALGTGPTQTTNAPNRTDPKAFLTYNLTITIACITIAFYTCVRYYLLTFCTEEILRM